MSWFAFFSFVAFGVLELAGEFVVLGPVVAIGADGSFSLDGCEFAKDFSVTGVAIAGRTFGFAVVFFGSIEKALIGLLAIVLGHQ